MLALNWIREHGRDSDASNEAANDARDKGGRVVWCGHRWTMWTPIGDLRHFSDAHAAYYELQREYLKSGAIQIRLAHA